MTCVCCNDNIDARCMNTAAAYYTILKLGRDEHLCRSGNMSRDIIAPVEVQEAHIYTQ